MNAIDRLGSLKVCDIISSNVVSISASQSMEEAAAKLRSHEISGAPVIDEQGRCVGMLTANDFVTCRAAQHARENSLHGTDYRMTRPEGRPGYRMNYFDSNRVAECMTAAVQSIDIHASLLMAAKQMCLAHIHHLVALDKSGRPAGVVSSLDIVAALTHARDECDRHGRPQ